MKLNKGNISNSKVGKVVKFVLTSAPFAMLLSVVFFWYEMHKNDKESDELIGNLQQIEQSLSTRHIGIFPDYLDEINKLLSETPYTPNDTSKIIIFEDILFYGAFYNGSAFKNMIQKLTEMSNKGKKIIIAYYDNSKEWNKGRMFREVVQESWMYKSDLSRLAQDRRSIMDSIRNENPSGRNSIRMADSIASEKYFAIYRDNRDSDFSERRERILVPFYDAAKNDNLLFKRMDVIINNCLNKSEHDITFADMYSMYEQITEQLIAFFLQHNIRTIKLDNYLTMSCWSNGEQVLFAFPGKFAADEIGFISHDLAILRYIDTMLKGVERGKAMDIE